MILILIVKYTVVSFSSITAKRKNLHLHVLSDLSQNDFPMIKLFGAINFFFQKLIKNRCFWGFFGLVDHLQWSNNSHIERKYQHLPLLSLYIDRKSILICVVIILTMV